MDEQPDNLPPLSHIGITPSELTGKDGTKYLIAGSIQFEFLFINGKGKILIRE